MFYRSSRYARGLILDGFLLLPFYFYLTACLPTVHRFAVQIEDPPPLEGEIAVFLDGERVGRVVALQPVEAGRLRLVVEVPSDFREEITRRSRFRLRPDPEDPKRWHLLIEPRPGAPLQYGEVVRGEVERDLGDIFSSLLHRFREGLKPLLRQLETLEREAERLPETPEFQGLRRDLEDLARALKEAQEKAQESLIPKLKRELDRLQRELEEILKEREGPQVETIKI